VTPLPSKRNYKDDCKKDARPAESIGVFILLTHMLVVSKEKNIDNHKRIRDSPIMRNCGREGFRHPGEQRWRIYLLSEE